MILTVIKLDRRQHNIGQNVVCMAKWLLNLNRLLMTYIVKNKKIGIGKIPHRYSIIENTK